MNLCIHFNYKVRIRDCLFVSSSTGKIWNFGNSVLFFFISSFDFAQGVIETRFVSLTTTSIILSTMCQ